MEINHICMGCMSDKGEADFCPHCGYKAGSVPISPFALKPGTVLNQKYLVGRVLGNGGFGITYIAKDMDLGIKLAVKEYFPSGLVTRDSEISKTVTSYSGDKKDNFDYGLEKFIDEARTLAKFDDVAEIVSIKDFFRENGTAYLVMSYIDGITLKEYLAQNGGRLPLDAVLTFMLPVMKALERVHAAGMLHRDISPDNIFVTTNYNVKLLDFGAARNAMGEHSQSLSVLLKPGYAPEEQYRSHGKQGPWTDVYATAATMYKLLTGETPPEALDRFDVDEIKPLSALGLDIPKSVEAPIMKALSIRADGRFATMQSFEQALTQSIGKDIAVNGKDITIDLEISEYEAKFGAQKQLSLDASICPVCQGRSQTCNACGGRGTLRQARSLAVTVPPGTLNGVGLRINGEGEPGLHGGKNGDLIVRIKVATSQYVPAKKSTGKTVAIVILSVAALILLMIGINRQAAYESMKSDYYEANASAVSAMRVVNKVKEQVPALISNIKIENEDKNGKVLSKSSSNTFSSSSVRFISISFDLERLDNSKKNVFIKIYTPSDALMTYGSSASVTSPTGYTAEADDNSISIGSDTGSGIFNRQRGTYEVEYWYNGKQLARGTFTIS